jgi:glycine/D-amino acid oxidase-like deaminating enzyme
MSTAPIDVTPASPVATGWVAARRDRRVGQLAGTPATQSPPSHGQAIVIGGRADGLRAASELAQRFLRVTIIERDRVAPDLDGPGDPTAAYLRQHALPTHRVRLVEGCEVTAFLSGSTSEQLTGVQVRLRPGPGVGTAADPWRALHADQVIDTRRSISSHAASQRSAP